MASADVEKDVTVGCLRPWIINVKTDTYTPRNKRRETEINEEERREMKRNGEKG